MPAGSEHLLQNEEPMPKLSSNSLNGLVSELNGFHQHAHRFETLIKPSNPA